MSPESELPSGLWGHTHTPLPPLWTIGLTKWDVCGTLGSIWKGMGYQEACKSMWDLGKCLEARSLEGMYRKDCVEGLSSVTYPDISCKQNGEAGLSEPFSTVKLH